MEDPVIFNPTASKHDGTVIFLHGLGDSGHGWSAGFDAIREPNIKYIFPTASVKPVTLNGGFPMPSWFDITSLDSSGAEDETGIKKAASDLLEMVDSEAASSGIPHNKIIIGGFSQGGATALYAGATSTKELAGVVALSSWLPLHKKVEASDIVHKTVPVLQCHGDLDPMVSFNFGQMSNKLLISKGMNNCSFKAYSGMQHGSSAKEMADVKNFIQKILCQ